MPSAGRLGDPSRCPNCSHGCPGCPHTVVGPAVSGSGNVHINGKPALRVGDRGEHSSCCGGNTWEAVQGAPGVKINGRAAHRVDDADHHCGGMGKLAQGSPNVRIGNHCAGGRNGAGTARAPEHVVWARLVDQHRRPLSDVVAHIESPDRSVSLTRRTDINGYIRMAVEKLGEYLVWLGPEHPMPAAHPPPAHPAPAPAAARSAPGGHPAPAARPAPAPAARPAPAPQPAAPAATRAPVGSTQAQPLNMARPSIHEVGWDIEVVSPQPHAKLYIEPGTFDAQHDRAEHPTPPPMPKVRIQARVHFTHEGSRQEVHTGQLIWEFHIKGRYRVRAPDQRGGYRWQPYDLPAGRIATAPGQLVEATLSPAEVVGGDLEVYVRYEAAANSPHAGIKVAQVVPCGEILGHNPDRRELHALIIAQAAHRRAEHARRGTDYGDLSWLFFRLFQQESKQQQFNAASRNPRAGSTAEKPNYGDPAGVGIAQRDAEAGEWHFRPGGPQANLQYTNEFWPRIFWNWKENVIAGIELFYDKLSVARHRLYRQVANKQKQNPRAHIPNPPDGVVLREAIRSYNGGTEYRLNSTMLHGFQWQVEPHTPLNQDYTNSVLGQAEAVPACVPNTGQYPVPAEARIMHYP